MMSLLINRLSRIIYPPFCVECKQMLADEMIVLCDECMQRIKRIVSITMPTYGEKKSTVFAIADYQDPLRSLIISKHSMRPVAAKQMGYLMWNHLPLNRLDFDCIIPIPLHWTRYARRGYNQSEIIAQQISFLSTKPILHVLQRVKMTSLQASLSNAQERIKNVHDAFVCTDNHSIVGKKILIVDDLMTTGSTFTSAARVLYKSGAQRVDGAVLCRVI